MCQEAQSFICLSVDRQRKELLARSQALMSRLNLDSCRQGRHGSWPGRKSRAPLYGQDAVMSCFLEYT